MHQVEYDGVFDGMVVDEKNKQIKSIRYDLMKTKGFYQLRNVVSGIQDIFNVYMFVGDASSPSALYATNNETEDGGEVEADALFLAKNGKYCSSPIWCFTPIDLFPTRKRIKWTLRRMELALFRCSVDSTIHMNRQR